MTQSKSLNNAFKLNGVISVKEPRFGAVGDGVTDDSIAIQAAITYAATIGNAHVVFPPAVAYKLNSGISIDTNKVSVDLGGNLINFAGMTTGKAITITNSSADANVRNYLNHAHPIKNGIVIGPGVATTAVTAIDITDTGVLNTLSGLLFEGLGFVNFAKDVNLGAGAFCITFRKCNFTILSGTPSTYSINIPIATNAGERNVFEDCMWNNRKNILSQANANADTYFVNCSQDGFGSLAMTITGGRVTISGGHIENTDDTGIWYNVSGTNSGLLLTGGVEMYFASATKASFSPFNSDSSCVRMGVQFGDCVYAAGATHSVPIVSGTGVVGVHNLAMIGTIHPVISAKTNMLAYPSFDAGTLAGDSWTVSSSGAGVTPVAAIPPTAPPTGANALHFQGGVGAETSIASIIFPIKPGQNVQGEFWWLIPTTTGTGYSFSTTANWLDAGKNVISTPYAYSRTALQTTWFRDAVNPAVPAPSGAAYFQVAHNLFGPIAVATVDAYTSDYNMAVF